MNSRSIQNLASVRRCAAALAVLFIGVATSLLAQASPGQSSYRSRRTLDSIASSLERANKRDEAVSIRDRMRVGDFYPGDRIAFEIYGGEEPFRDTVSVRAGQEIVIQAFPAFSLKGVLRSEADSAITAQLRRYVQAPVVRTTPTLRLIVTGAVGRPGFVTVRGDAAVSDVVSAAGGLTSQSQLPKSTMKRADETIIGQDSLRVVFRSGMTLDQADIRSGDELVVKEKKQTNWLSLVWAGSAAFGLVLSIIQLAR